jgi:hypothetical protein
VYVCPNEVVYCRSEDHIGAKIQDDHQFVAVEREAVAGPGYIRGAVEKACILKNVGENVLERKMLTASRPL